MLNMKYTKDNTVYPVEFSIISNNVVELKGDFPVQSDGFMLSRPDREDNWDYSDFVTVYRNVDSGIQFSNDYSIYTPKLLPEQATPVDFSYKPTPEELEEQERKRKEIGAIPTNAELSNALMELAQNINDIENAIVEIGNMFEEVI